MQTLTPKELATIKEALEISQAFKIYGDGREEHQKECANIINKLSSSLGDKIDVSALLMKIQ